MEDSSYGETLNIVTQEQSKVVLKVPSEPKKALYSKKMVSYAISSYDLMSQL